MLAITRCKQRWCKLTHTIWLNVVQAFGVTVLQTLTFTANYANAQNVPPIVPDRTLPNNSSIQVQENMRIIEGGTKAGSNLFHSFERFSVPDGSTAYFNNALNIQNIISRVTGTSESIISGTLKTNGTANLFLLNPNGIIFNGDADLDIRGSFVASTARSLVFRDGTEFSATKPQTRSLLTVSVPIGLQFGANPSDIQVQDVNLVDKQSLQPGQTGITRALVGGNVVLDDSGIRAQQGRIELGGLESAGTVDLAVNNNYISLNFPPTIARASVSLKNGSVLSVRGTDGGSIAINANNFTLTDQSKLRAGIAENSGSFRSQAGDIVVNATGETTLGADSYIYNVVLENGIGNAGNIYLTSGSIKVMDGAQIYTATRAKGNAGSIYLDIKGRALFSGTGSAFVSGAISAAEQGSIGQGGSVNIKAGTLDVVGGAILQANSGGIGNAADVNITAQNISFDGGESISSGLKLSGAYSEVEKSGVGKGGSVIISADSVSVKNGARLVASTFGNGDAGSVIINANKTVSFDGIFKNYEANKLTDIYSSGAFSRVDGNEDGTTGIGKSGSVSITTGSLTVANGAVLTTSTFGKEGAGSIDIKANDAVSFSGEGFNFLSSGAYSRILSLAAGQGGSINITTPMLSVTDGAVITTSTYGQGSGGNINVDAHSVVLKGIGPDRATRGIFSAVNEGASGQGGNIKINTGSLIGTDGALITAETLGNGNGGNIQVNADKLTLNSGAEISVSSSNSGSAGNIEALANSIRLDNQSKITAITKSTDSGNIKLGAQNLLLLRHGSQISTTAGTDQAGGNGGKIAINAKNGFVVALPTENSDITANAFKGSGGRVDINAAGIFGLKVFNREDLVRIFGFDLTNIDFQSLPSSITAISQTSPNLNGQVIINTPDVDPNRGLVQLPVNLVDASQQIDTRCSSSSRQTASSFTITGLGGLPFNPRNEALSSDAVQLDWVSLKPSTENRSRPQAAKNPNKPIPTPIVEATGWVRNKFGEVVLTAPTMAPHTSWQTTAFCHGS